MAYNYQKICDNYSKYVGHFLETSHQWRREQALMYAIRDHHPFVSLAKMTQPYSADASLNNTQPKNNNLTVVSIAPSYLHVTVGMLMQYGFGFEAIAQDSNYRTSSDCMSDAIKWATNVAGHKQTMNGVIEDLLVRGVGASVLEMGRPTSGAIAGVPRKKRKHHVFFDRGNIDDINAADMAWCGFADPVYIDTLEDYKKFVGLKKSLCSGAGGFREQLLQYSNSEDMSEIVFLSDYFWSDTQNVKIIDNPFLKNAEKYYEAFEREPNLYEIVTDFTEKHQLPLEQFNGNSQWKLAPDAWGDYTQMLKGLKAIYGIEVPVDNVYKVNQKVFHRARIDSNGEMWECGQSFSQDCHAMNIATAYYDRQNGVYYGLMRGAAYVQEMINDAMRNFQMLSDRSAKGGNVAVAGAGVASEIVLQGVEKGVAAMTLPQGATITSYGLPDAGSIQLNFVNLLLEIMPIVWLGSKEMLGQYNTDTPSASLFKAAQAQMKTGLSHILHNLENYLKNDGLCYRDIIYKIAQIRNVQVLPRIAPNHKEDKYFELSMQNLSRDYAINVIRKNDNEDDRVEAFAKLIELVGMLPEQSRAMAMPIIIEASTMDEQLKDKFAELMQPQPPNPQVEELNMRERVAVVATQESTAEVQKSMAMEAQANAKAKVEQIEVDIAKKASEINKNKAMVEKTNVDAAVAASQLIDGYAQSQFL